MVISAGQVMIDWSDAVNRPVRACRYVNGVTGIAKRHSTESRYLHELVSVGLIARLELGGAVR